GIDGIHVLRWAILPGSVRDSGLTVPETLVFWAVFDGTRAEYLRELGSGAARARIDEVYGHCEGYPGAHATAGEVARYLEAHAPARDWIACFDGTPGRSVADIENDEKLRVRLRDEFLAKNDWSDKSLSHIYLGARQWVQSEPAFATLDHPDVGRAAPLGWVPLLGIGVLALLVVAFGFVPVLRVVAILIGVGVGVVVAWLVGLHFAERQAERSFVQPARRWFD